MVQYAGVSSSSRDGHCQSGTDAAAGCASSGRCAACPRSACRARQRARRGSTPQGELAPIKGVRHPAARDGWRRMARWPLEVRGAPLASRGAAAADTGQAATAQSQAPRASALVGGGARFLYHPIRLGRRPRRVRHVPCRAHPDRRASLSTARARRPPHNRHSRGLGLGAGPRSTESRGRAARWGRVVLRACEG